MLSMTRCASGHDRASSAPHCSESLPSPPRLHVALQLAGGGGAKGGSGGLGGTRTYSTYEDAPYGAPPKTMPGLEVELQLPLNQSKQYVNPPGASNPVQLGVRRQWFAQSEAFDNPVFTTKSWP
eukprot:124197-Prymnesium_polylepis.3